jgi:hypothetical protein
MKIKIIKCSGEEYWYKNHIGEIMEVVTSRYIDGYDTVGNNLGTKAIARCINKCDVAEVSCKTCKFLGKLVPCVECDENCIKWQYKGEDKVNYIPEICKMLGAKIGERFYIKVGEKYSKYYFNINGLMFDDVMRYDQPMLSGILSGEYKIEKIVEFAKPIWCNYGDQYKYVAEDKEVCTATFDGSTLVDYYNRKFGNMFAPDAVIPIEQINKIGDDMRSGKPNE